MLQAAGVFSIQFGAKTTNCLAMKIVFMEKQLNWLKRFYGHEATAEELEGLEILRSELNNHRT